MTKENSGAGIKRYEMDCIDCGGVIEALELYEGGEWVRYTDCEAENARLRNGADVLEANCQHWQTRAKAAEAKLEQIGVFLTELKITEYVDDEVEVVTEITNTLDSILGMKA